MTGESPSLVRDRLLVIDRARQELKDKLLAVAERLAAADLAIKRAEGKNDRRLARRARESIVAEQQILHHQLSNFKRIRNEIAAESNDARARMFVSIVVERFPADVVETIWQEAEQRVESARIAAAERASTRLVGSAIGVRGSAPGMRERA